MAKPKDKSRDFSPRIENRKAWHDYFVLDKLEAGVVLKGSEVKSIRLGQASLAEGFASIDPRTLELRLNAVHIAPYPHAGEANNHEPLRPRRLLVHKREVLKLLDQTKARGGTLVPLALYFVRGRVKVELGIVTGKKKADKREDIKRRDAQREIQRAMSRKG